MNQLDRQYQELLLDIMHNGVHKETRNGKTKSVFGKQIRHKMKDGFPLLTTKKMYWKGIVTELLWFLRGDTNIKYLIDNDCHIWDGDAYKNYCKWYNSQEGFVQPPVHNIKMFIERIKTDFEFAKQWGELGPIYGKQWRSWKGKLVDKSKEFDAYTAWVPEQIDQIANLINDLKTNPDSRRLMVSAWNVGELDKMTLPPCHFSFQCYSHEKDGKRYLSLAWNQRSVDAGLGLPFNIASYGLLLEILAKITNMTPYELIGNLGDTHLYENHLSQVREQITRKPYTLPKLEINDQYWVDDCGLDTHILSMLIEDFKIEDYQFHPTIKLPLSN
jgi:thymidylate synthase